MPFSAPSFQNWGPGPHFLKFLDLPLPTTNTLSHTTVKPSGTVEIMFQIVLPASFDVVACVSIALVSSWF